MRIKPTQPFLIVAILTLLLLQGCGFQLRGAVVLPQEMAATWVAGHGVSGELTEAVSESIRRSNGGVATAERDATAVLELSNESFSRHVATVDSDGKVSEYLLNYQVHWKLRDKSRQLIHEGVVKQRENYLYNTKQVLGKAQEEQYLRRVMVRKATADLMRALLQR